MHKTVGAPLQPRQSQLASRRIDMHSIFWIIGVVVVVIAVLSFVGLR